MEKWDKREQKDEKNNKQTIWNSMFNWKVIVLTFILFFAISFSIVTVFPPPSAFGGEENTWKLFDDGVTYYKDGSGGHNDYGIIHNDKKISCNASDTDYHGSMLHPQCLEIILRSIP